VFVHRDGIVALVSGKPAQIAIFSDHLTDGDFFRQIVIHQTIP
jgi:hypothetical protein